MCPVEWTPILTLIFWSLNGPSTRPSISSGLKLAQLCWQVLLLSPWPHRNVGTIDNVILEASTNSFLPIGLRTPRKPYRFTFEIDARTQGLVYQRGLLETSPRKQWESMNNVQRCPHTFARKWGGAAERYKKIKNPSIRSTGAQIQDLPFIKSLLSGESVDFRRQQTVVFTCLWEGLPRFKSWL